MPQMSPDFIVGFIFGFLATSGLLLAVASYVSYLEGKKPSDKKKRIIPVEDLPMRHMGKACNKLENIISFGDVSEEYKKIMSKILVQMKNIHQDMKFAKEWINQKK